MQALRLGERAELAQRVLLDLARALARQAEHPPDVVERPWLLAEEAVAQLDDPPLAVGEVLERLGEPLRVERLGGRVERRDGVVVGDQVAEFGGVVVGARRRPACRARPARATRA